jgi:hypothetical protein
LKPMSEVSCRDMDANRRPPRNSSVKMRTYTGLRLKGAAGGAVPAGPGLMPLLPEGPAPAAAAEPGSGDGLLLLLPEVPVPPLLLAAGCGLLLEAEPAWAWVLEELLLPALAEADPGH